MKKTIFGMLLSMFLVLGAASVFAGPGWANVRVIHASPDAPRVDIWAGGTPLFEGVAYKDVTGYETVKRGTYNVQVVPEGMSEPVVISADLKLKPAMDYTVLAIGNLASIQPLVLEDRRFAVSSRFASVRFVHTSPDAPAVDIKIKDGKYLFKDVGFGEYSQYRKVQKGTYDLQVLVAGTDTIALEVNDVNLKRGVMYSAIALGELGEGSLEAMLVEDR
jgi:hypothetical protein